jgi:calcium-dependent protein kinase
MKVPYKEAKIMAQHIFQRVDVNNSGFIDYSEFLVAASTMEVAISPDNIDLAFDCFDENKDGTISVKEFQNKLGKNVSESHYKELIR